MLLVSARRRHPSDTPLGGGEVFDLVRLRRLQDIVPYFLRLPLIQGVSVLDLQSMVLVEGLLQSEPILLLTEARG